MSAGVAADRVSARLRVRIPAAFFGIVLGLAGLGGSWRAAHRVWGVPAGIGEALMLVATLVWAALVALTAAKWIAARDEALAEMRHPVQCCFVGLIGVATMLVAGAALPYARDLAWVLFVLGSLFTLGFAVWRTGQLWHGERDHGATTAVLYLPAVAGSFVAGSTAAAFGYPDWGQLAFGAGFFTWLAIESVLLHRLYTEPGLPVALRPTLGIQLAPPVVGAVAYLATTSGVPDMLVRAMFGYGLLQALLLLRLLPWIAEQPFAPSYWAFSFGATALATAPILMVERGATGAVATLAPAVFLLVNVVILVLAIGTLRLAIQGRLLPR
jgi:tellurite resistance protein